MTRDEEVRDAIDTIIPVFSSNKGRTYEQALMASGFEHGVNWADAHPKSPWISVEDDLPYNYKELINTHTNLDYEKETVLVFTVTSEGVIDTDYMIYDNYDGWLWKYGLPKYWMPMPKLPKE